MQIKKMREVISFAQTSSSGRVFTWHCFSRSSSKRYLISHSWKETQADWRGHWVNEGFRPEPTLKGPWQFIMKGCNGQFCWHRVTGSSRKEVGLFHAGQTSLCSPFMLTTLTDFLSCQWEMPGPQTWPPPSPRAVGRVSPDRSISLHTCHLGPWGGTHTRAHSWSSHMEPWDCVQLEIPKPV